MYIHEHTNTLFFFHSTAYTNTTFNYWISQLKSGIFSSDSNFNAYTPLWFLLSRTDPLPSPDWDISQVYASYTIHHRTVNV